ncbi:PBECR2 nuclease fold domain-containing protein [Campylobacter upsaliensis]
MQFNFNFEAFEQSGKEKNEAINYLKSLNSSIDFDKLEQETKGDESAIYEALKGGNFSFSKPSIEQTRQKLLKNKENEALKAEFNAGLSWLGEEKKQNFNFYDFKKAKEKANSKQGLIEADLKAKEKELKRKEALFETRLKERGIIAKSFDDMLDQSGAYLGADLLEKGLNKLGFKDENYIFESEKEDIKKRALKSVREKLERGDLEFNEREKHALRSKYDELDYKKALEKEKERLRLSQKSGNFSEAEREFIENDLGFFNTLFNDDKENIKEFKEKVKSEGVISSEIIKAANTLKAFDEGNLFKNMLFADEKEKKEFQQNFLNDAYKIAELSGFDDVGLDKKGELYFIKDEQKYLVNTGFFDNFAQLLNDTKFEFAGGVLGGMKGFNSGKSAKGKVAKSILGAAAGSFGGAFLDAKIADMYLNRESDFKKNLDFAIQAGLLSMAGDGVILSVKPLAKGLYKGVKKGGEILGEYSILGTLKTLPQQNIQAAEKIIDEVFSPKMKEELKAAQEEFGGSVRGEDLKNAFFANLQKKFTQKYGENDSKTKSVAKIAEIFNTNSLKTRQQAMLDLVRSDKDGSTLAYLLEIAKDDVKIQSNLKNMLNLASSNVEKNLKNLNINPREIKHILDEFEAGNKAAFKEVESQISKLYDENYRVVLSKGEYENIKEEFRQNGVNLEEMTPFLRDLEANVFNENGVTFTQLNNFRKNLNFYIFNKDKTPNFINTLKKIGENILKNEIDKGIDNIFSQNKAAYESIKELYSTSLKDYATLKSLNESIKNLKLQDSAKSADEVLNSLIKYAKGQGEKGVNNLQKIKDYLGEENNAFLEMQILNKLFKESVVENDRASLRVFDSESFLGRVRELVGENELYERKIGKEFLEELSPSAMPKQISIDEFLNTLENFKNKENFLKHIEKDPKRKDYLNLIEPTLKEPDIAFKKLENGVEKEKFIKKFSDGKDFFYLLATKDNKETILTAFKTDKINTILKEFNTDIIPTFIRQGSKGKAAGTTNEGIITQPLFKSKEAREFLELVEGFHKLYKNDASIAKNLVQGTASQLSTSIATSAEGAIKQKVVKGGFDPIFRLLPDKILFGLFAKQIQGGALRYHLKKALSRSLNYDDFKIKLEKELKRTNFNSNTSRLIDEFMQNLEDFNREKEQFLEAKRIEQARIKEEERKRAEEIYKRQEEIYQAQEANNLKDILEAEEKPLKDEFGVNFEGFKGKEAIEKLLEEQRGQVKGAFYKEGLGEIDLVWGDKNYGLEHILNKHGGEFKNLARELSEAVENGKIVKDDKGRLRLEYENKIVGIKDNWKGEKTAHWVVTAYVKKEKEASLYTSASFTKGEALPLNSNESIAQKALNLHEKLYLKDNDTPLNVEYKIVNKDDIKPTFTLSKTQFRSQKQEDLIKKIKENFNPDLLVNIRGDLKKGNPIITKEGEVISGNHRAAALKELEGENLSKYQNAVKEAFGVELKENEMLVRVADTSEAEIRRFSAASNEGLENNLGEQGVSLFAKYQDKIKALKEAKKPFVADDVYNLKYLVNKALGESSITKENDTSKALFASLARGRNNTILKALNELEKENLEQVSKVANMFFDNAGAFYNLTHDLDLPKMQNLQNYFSDVLVSAAKADFTRAEDFARLNEDIRAFLDSGDKNAMLKLSPNLVSDLLAKAMGAGFARFARLENPSASLYEFLNGLKKDLLEKGAPDLFSGGKGIKLNERDEFDFAKELILKGQDSEEKFRLYQNLEELKAWSGEQKNTKLNTALKALDEVDESKLSEDQKELLRLFKGEIKSVKIQIKDLKDIYTLNQGSRKEGAKKILIKHYGEEKTGGLSSDELLSLKEVIKKGKINLNSLEIKDDFLRYGYDYEKDGVKLRVVIDEFKDGKKVFDYYSDRNFNHYEQGGYKPDLPTPSEIIPQNAKSERAEFESFKDKIKELYTKYEGLSPYDKSESQLRIKLLDEEIEPEIKKEFKNIIDKFKGADNKDKILRVIKENKEELSDYLAFHIALRKDIDIDGHGEGKVDFYDKSIRDFIKFRENKQWSEIDESKYRALAALENLSNKNTSLYFSFRDLNGKVGEFKTYPRIQDLLFYDLILGYDLKNAVILSTKDKLLKEKLIEKLKAYIDKKIYADFLEYKIKDLESRNPKNSYFENYKDEKWDEEALKSFKKELEDLRANEKAQKLEAKGSEDIIFTDKKGKEHTLTKETQKAWLEAFNLKSLEEAYIPNFKAEVKEAINRVLGGEEIKLTKGSFEKLLKRDREEFLPYIKDTLEKANAVIKQVDGALIFAKDYRNERLGKFFASVSRNDEGEWIITSNAPKNLNNLKNKLNEGGELLYSDLPELTIIAKPDLDANALNSEANLKDIIAQKANLEAVNKQKDKEFLEAYEKADFKGKVELAKQDINEEIKFLEKQKEEFERITQQKDYNDIELEQARKILENAKEEVEGHYRIKYMQNGKEMRAYISKTDYFNQGKILSKDEILHKIIQKTIYKDKIENIKKTSDKLKKQIKIIDEYLKEYGDNEAGAISDDIIEKFKYYDFAKNAGKGAVIIGERRKGLYEQAQKVLNSRLLKAKKRSAQSKKNYNITYDEARKLFYKGDMSEEQKELFQSVLPIAQKLNVRIRTAIREPYEDMIKDTTNIAGMYRYELNTATLKKGGNYTDTQRAETLLHELIHSVTSRAMSLYKTPLRDKMLSKTQIKAIDEIDQIYKKLYKFKKTFKLQDENGSDLYGIKNSHEMLAELANPMFSSKLKEIGLYEKLVNNIMKIILSVRDFIRLRSDKNVYEKLKQCLKDIIENYKDDFTQEYEKQNIRDFTLTSQTQKEQIYTQRQEIKNTLKAKINQAITNENTGEKAILTNKGISKMLSDKAISKSVDNGFSREEHLRAVGVVDELFKRAKRAFSKRDEKDKNLSIYRYNAPFKNANALMTLKEYKQNGKRIYSLELENLEAAKFNPSGKDLAEQLSKSKDADTTTFHTPIDNPDESIAQKSDNIYHSNPHLGAGLVGGVLNGVEQDENGNLSFDPVKFAMGFLGGSVGSFALKKGFQILEKNPELKEKIINELAHTLAQGFEKAREKYSLLNLLEPRYIVKNEKGRKIQAKTMLKELEREQNKNLQNIIRQNLQNLPLNNKPLELSEKQVKLLINRFANARNLKEHLNTRADNRKELYALLNDTLENPQIHFIKEGRDKYVKRYKGDVNEPYFYLLITQDKDKIFITHLKTRDIKYLSRQISNAEQIKKGADIIEALSQRAGDDKASASKKDYSK